MFFVRISRRSPNQYHFGKRVMEEGGADTHKSYESRSSRRMRRCVSEKISSRGRAEVACSNFRRSDVLWRCAKERIRGLEVSFAALLELKNSL